MKVFCYFVEPASYTLHLAQNIYDQNNIDYCFIKSSTYAKSKQKDEKTMSSKSIYLQEVKASNNYFQKA